MTRVSRESTLFAVTNTHGKAKVKQQLLFTVFSLKSKTFPGQGRRLIACASTKTRKRQSRGYAAVDCYVCVCICVCACSTPGQLLWLDDCFLPLVWYCLLYFNFIFFPHPQNGCEPMSKISEDRDDQCRYQYGVLYWGQTVEARDQRRFLRKSTNLAFHYFLTEKHTC